MKLGNSRCNSLGFVAIIGTIGIGVFILFSKRRLKKYLQDIRQHIKESKPPYASNGNLLEKEVKPTKLDLSMDDFEAQEVIIEGASSPNLPTTNVGECLKIDQAYAESISTKSSSSQSHDNDTGFCTGGLLCDCGESYRGSSNKFRCRAGYKGVETTSSGSYCLTSSNPSSSRGKFDHDKARGYIEVLLAALEGLSCQQDASSSCYLRESADAKGSTQPPKLLLIRTLTTISDLAAFSENQNILREAGCLNHLMRLLSTSTDMDILTACTRCIANLSLNVENQRLLRECTPFLLKLLLKGGTLHSSIGGPGEKISLGGSRFTIVILSALINLSVLTPLIEAYTAIAINKVFKLLEEKNYEIKINALKLLVNLSCYKELIPLLLRVKVDKHILTFLVDSTIDAQMLIRSTTLLEHLLKFANKHNLLTNPIANASSKDLSSIFGQNVNLASDLGQNHFTQCEPSLSNECTVPSRFCSAGSLLNHLYNSNVSHGSLLKGKVSQLKCHRNEDVRENACKIYGYLNS